MSPLHQLRRSSRILVGFALLGLAVSALATFVQPLRYGATIRVLIIQRSSFGVDPFTAVKSAERVAASLAEVITTSDFFTKVLAEDPSIRQDYFSDRTAVRRRQWQRMVRTSISPGTGLLSVTILHPERDEASKISDAVSRVITNRGRDYVGGDVDIKLVDSAVPTSFPISPNIPVNLAAGIILGAVVGAVYVLRRSVAT